MTDPAPATTFIHLDATTVLARSLAAKGIYPAVDVLESTSTMLQPWIVGDAHSIVWAHEHTRIANLVYWKDKPVALSIVQRLMFTSVPGAIQGGWNQRRRVMGSPLIYPRRFYL